MWFLKGNLRVCNSDVSLFHFKNHKKTQVEKTLFTVQLVDRSSVNDVHLQNSLRNNLTNGPLHFLIVQMSKRRASVDEEQLPVETGTMRSAKINRLISSASTVDSNQLHQHNDLEFSQNLIAQVLTRVSEITNSTHVNIPLQTQAILDAYPERLLPLLHYQNQLIEIPLTGELKLCYNESFPYRREPISISTDVNYFLLNLNSFKIFKKVMIKNCRLSIISNSFENIYRCNQCAFVYSQGEQHTHDNGVPPTPLLKFQCNITSYDHTNQVLKCPVTEETLRFSNILLQKSNIWNAINGILTSASLSSEQRNELEQRCFQNLFKCFQILDNVNIAVTVDNQGQVSVSNIFHNYFTS